MKANQPLACPPAGKTWETTTAAEASNGSGFLPAAWLDVHNDALETEGRAFLESGGRGPNHAFLTYFLGRVGRPQKGTEVPMVQRSLRVPAHTWAELERCASEQGASPHALAIQLLMRGTEAMVQSALRAAKAPRSRKTVAAR